MDPAPPSSSALAVRMSAGICSDLNPLRAIDQVTEQCTAGLGGAAADLAVLFFSGHHVESARAISYIVRRRLKPRCLIGASAEAVIGGAQELERLPGVSMLAASIPGVGVHPFKLDRAPGVAADAGGTSADELTALAVATGMTRVGYRGTILLADPFSVAMNAMLPVLSRARPQPTGAGGKGGEAGRGPIIGGLASAADKPGGNVLVLDDGLVSAGAVGVSLSGRVRIDSLVSQGCRPFGPTFIVTGARNQMIQTLSGRPALQALHEAIESLDERSKSLLQRGVYLGRAVNEYKDRFGRGDFLIRAVVGADPETGMLAVGDLMRVGQTVRFHHRDAATADEDLALLLDREQLYDPPAGALLFTCNGRGKRLFDSPNHDAVAIAKAFAPQAGGEEKAKAGAVIGAGGGGGVGAAGGSIPLAGLFAAGEIGPVGDEVFLHGHTASVAIFRAPQSQDR